MRIGIDASRANHLQRTGVENYAFYVIEKMQSAGCRMMNNEKVEFVLYTEKPLHGELAKLTDNWTQKVLKWPPFSSVQDRPWRFWTQIRLSLEMLINPTDVLFIPAHVMPLVHPKKTVVMIHDIAALKFPESYNWFERWYSVWSAKYALRKAWKIIVPSEFVKDELKKLETNFRPGPMQKRNWKSGDNIFVVQHGYDKCYRKIEDETEIEKVLKKYSVQKPFIMTVGRLEEKKNTVRIIKAFEQIKHDDQQSMINDFRLLLIGKPGYGYETVKRAIDESPFRKDIITPGFVSEEDLPYLMNAAKVFVFPSLYEGFGLPVLESMACGTPVVASGGNASASFSTASQEVGGDACMYVDPVSVDEIVQAVELLMTNNEQRTTNIEKSLERVKNFSWEKCAGETMKILLD